MWNLRYSCHRCGVVDYVASLVNEALDLHCYLDTCCADKMDRRRRTWSIAWSPEFFDGQTLM